MGGRGRGRRAGGDGGCSMGSGGAGMLGEEWSCAGVRVGEILRQVEC